MNSKFYFFKGRIALYAILKAMGISINDEIIMPGFSCVVVPNAIIYVNAKPVYVDIDSTTFNIDPAKIEEKLTDRTKVIIAQHTFGIPAEMDRILEIAGKHNLYVIEDSCHAIGSKYKGRSVGTFGDASFFSSQWSKPVTTGLGGWAVVNNQELRDKMERFYHDFIEPKTKEIFLLRFQYFLYSEFLTPSLFWFAMNSYRKLSGSGVAVGSSDSCELEGKKPFDYEKKMSSWQKDLLKKQLKEVDRTIMHRKLITSLYEKYLPEIGIKTLRVNKDIEPVFLRYPVLSDDKNMILKKAEENRIEIGDWFVSPVHPNLTGWEKVGYKKGMCPIAEDVCRSVINLPTHSKISEREVLKIVRFLEKTRGEKANTLS